ncbi:MAG: TonB-dependent receptor [Novosphingobium sp.]|nr:TonB-dependent receptor [Novosphingobium sp.]
MKDIMKLALASASVFAFATPVFAQDADEGASTADVIIVEARRKDESLQDVPLTVNAVTSESIAKLNVREFTEITSLVPGLAMQANPNGIGTTSVVRGVKYDVNASGNNGTIEFYRNDAPITSGALFQAMYDIGQIEVLRGPQGTLRGRASPSGSITITTRRPDLFQAGGYMQGTVNDIGGWNLNGAINVPVIDGKLAVRVSGLVSESEGSRVKSVRNEAKPFSNNQALRVSVSADPFDGILILDGTYERVESDRLSYDQMVSAKYLDGTFGDSPVNFRGKDRKSYMFSPRLGEQAFDIYTWKAKLNLFGQSLTYIGGKTDQTLYSVAPFDIAGVFINDTLPLGSLSGPAAEQGTFARVSRTKGDQESHQALLQNQERIAGLVDYVIGYFQQDAGSTTLFNSPTGLGIPAGSQSAALIGIPPGGDREMVRWGVNTEKSYFGNLTVHPIEGLEISGGLRHIKYRNEANLQIPAFGAILFPEDTKNKKTIYAASIKYNVSPDLMVYASTGTSWRPGAIAIGAPTFRTSALQDSFTRTDPETSTSYEVGFKSEWLDRRLTLNVAAFYQKFTSYPYRAPGIGVYAIDNSSQARNPAAPSEVRSFNYIAGVPVKVKGVEVEVNFQATENLTIGGVLSYSDGKIKGGTVPCLDLNGDGVPDIVSQAPTLESVQAAYGDGTIAACNVTQRASQEAPFGFTLQGEYNQPLSSAVDGYVRGLLSYKGNSIGDPTNPYDSVKSHGILNVFLGVREPTGAWDLSFFAKNLLNTYRYTTSDTSSGLLGTPYVNVGTQPASSITDSRTNYFGVASIAPREFGVNLRIAFGSR